MKITLPWPPSVNTYWRHPTRGPLAGRHLISEAGRAYRQAVTIISKSLPICESVAGRMSVVISATPPDKRVRDLDNILKSLLDSLVHAGIIADDGLIDELHIVRKSSSKPGHVDVEINPME